MVLEAIRLDKDHFGREAGPEKDSLLSLIHTGTDVRTPACFNAVLRACSRFFFDTASHMDAILTELVLLRGQHGNNNSDPNLHYAEILPVVARFGFGKTEQTMR